MEALLHSRSRRSRAAGACCSFHPPRVTASFRARASDAGAWSGIGEIRRLVRDSFSQNSMMLTVGISASASRRELLTVTDARIDGMARRGEGAHLRVRGRRSFSPTRAALSGAAAAQ